MIKKYTDVLLAALFALATGLFVPFSPALLWESINWNLLGILFCLMTITAEIGKWGIPRALCLHFFDGNRRGLRGRDGGLARDPRRRGRGPALLTGWRYRVIGGIN